MDNSCRDKLIKLLQEALIVEEKAVPIYNSHLRSVVFWAGLDENKAARIREVLGVLAEESKHHELMVKKVLDKMCEGNDVV